MNKRIILSIALLASATQVYSAEESAFKPWTPNWTISSVQAAQPSRQEKLGQAATLIKDVVTETVSTELVAAGREPVLGAIAGASVSAYNAAAGYVMYPELLQKDSQKFVTAVPTMAQEAFGAFYARVTNKENLKIPALAYGKTVKLFNEMQTAQGQEKAVQFAQDNKYTLALAAVIVGSYGIYKFYNYMTCATPCVLNQEALAKVTPERLEATGGIALPGLTVDTTQFVPYDEISPLNSPK